MSTKGFPLTVYGKVIEQVNPILFKALAMAPAMSKSAQYVAVHKAFDKWGHSKGFSAHFLEVLHGFLHEHVTARPAVNNEVLNILFNRIPPMYLHQGRWRSQLKDPHYHETL